MTARDPVAVPDFDALYLERDDPWQVSSSWYERRKLSVVMAGLPRPYYATAWEPGCGPGITTAALARRTGHLLASDSSIVAVEAARERLQAWPDVEVAHSALPDVPVVDPVELVVAAEFLYYIDDWQTSVGAIWSTLRPGGHLAAVHWAHHPHDAHRSGRDMHAMLALDAIDRGAQLVLGHSEQDFIYEVYEAAS